VISTKHATKLALKIGRECATRLPETKIGAPRHESRWARFGSSSRRITWPNPARIALTEALAVELAGAGVLVNAIAAGPIAPPGGTTPAFAAAVRAATPLGRWGGGRAIAEAVAALVTHDFIAGETLTIDGGRDLR
jgi:hypothetical protein